MEQMSNSAGELKESYSIYMDSAQAKINQFKATFQEFSTNVISSSFVKKLVDIGSLLLNGANQLAKYGTLFPMIISGITTIRSFKILRSLDGVKASVDAISSSMLNEKTSTDALIQSTANLSLQEKQAVVEATMRKAAGNEKATALANERLQVVGLTSAEQQMAVANTEVGTSAQGATVGIKAMWSAMSAGEKASVIMSLLSSIMTLWNAISSIWENEEPAEVQKRSISEVESELKQLNDTVSNTASEFKSLRESSEEIIPRFVQLSEGVDAFGKNVSLSEEQYSEYLSLCNELAKMFPSINMGMDANGNAMLSLSGNAEQLTNKLNDLVEAQRKVANQEIASKIPDAIKDIEELNERVDKAKSEFSNLNKEVWTNIYNHGVKEKYANYTTRFSSSEYGSDAKAVSAATKLMGQAAKMGIRGHLYDSKDSNGETIWHVNWNYDNFDPQKAKEVYENGLTQNERIIKDANERVKERWKALNPMLSAWMQTDSDFSELGEKMQNVAVSAVAGIDFEGLGLKTEGAIKEYIREHIIAPLSSGEVQRAFDDVKKWEEEFKKDFDGKTVFGNIDTNNRQVIEWTDDAINKNKAALEDWVDDVDELKGTISTILGTSAEYDGLEIAFSPILQTPNGAEVLSADTVDNYIGALIDKLKKSGKEWTTEDLLKLDAEGLEIDGKKIKGLIADVGETARATGEAMHFVGKDGALSKADTVLEDLAKAAGISKDKLLEFLNDSETAAQKTTAALTDLSDSLSNLKTKYDIISQAQADMFDSGITADTIKAIKDAIGEDKSVSYLDFLYEEGDAIKFNIEKWKEYSQIEIKGNREAIQGTIDKLTEERTKIQDRITDLNNATVKDKNWQEQLESENDKLRENTSEIEANQNKLSIYDKLYSSATERLDAYSTALDNFKNVSDTITKVSDSLTTVADLQERVRNGFTLSLEEALKFADVYPEILDSATVSADGQINLNSEIVNAFIKGKESELRAEIEAKIKKLEAEKEVATAKKNFAEMELKIAQSIGTGEGKISADTAAFRVNVADLTVKKLVDAGVDEATAYTKVCKEMSTASGNSALDIAENMGRAAESVATDMAGALGATVTNFSKAGEVSAKAWITSMSKSLKGQSEALKKLGISYDNNWWNNNGGNSGVNVWKPSTYTSKSVSSGKITLGNHSFNNDSEVQKFIKQLQNDMDGYTKSLKQYDGQIAALRAILKRSLEKFSTSFKDSQKEKTKTDSSKKTTTEKTETTETEKDNWFIKEYNRRNHLINMEKHEVSDYLNWLEKAYKKAYKEGLITLDDYYKYTEEIFNKRRELFKEHLSNVEHEISMREEYDGDGKKIHKLYKGLIEEVVKEIRAARKQGLTDNDDYIKELQDKYMSYKNARKAIEDEIKENAKDSVQELIDIRIKMIKQDIENEKDAISKKLSALKQFYDDQKQMLKDKDEEEKYLEEQKEKRKSVTDIQKKIAALELDNSAWAQKRKLELSQELADKQKELDDFEKERALKNAEDQYDKLYEQQEKALNKQTEKLDAKLNNAKYLYDKALADIKNGSTTLYEDMIKWNNQYGDGIQKTIKTAWEEAYKALQNYRDLFEKPYKNIVLPNATDYVKPKEKWDNSEVSDPKGVNKKKKITDKSGLPTIVPQTDGNKKTKKTTKTTTTTTGKGKTTTTTKQTTKTTTKDSNGNKKTKTVTTSGSGSSGSTKTTTPKTTAPTLDEATKRKVAAAIWNGNMGWLSGNDRTKRLIEVFGSKGASDIMALVSKMVGATDKADSAYSYLNMRKRFKGYASGTSNAASGLYGIDERGTETIFQSKNGNKYMMFTGGEMVLNARASKFLYEFATKGGNLFSGMTGILARGISGINPNKSPAEIRMGDIIINGNADKATVSEIRRAQRESVEMMLKEFKKLNK